MPVLIHSAETIGVEEGFDAAQLCRGFVAELRDLLKGTAADYVQSCQVPLVGVTDAKDSYDRLSTDTGFGSQKSLCFTIAALRQLLRRPNTCFRWTATTNMWVDVGTKAMDTTQLRGVLSRGEWSIEYSPEFIKQTAKRLKGVSELANQDMPGRAFLAEEHDLLQFCMKLGSEPGWHFVDGVGVHVEQLRVRRLFEHRSLAFLRRSTRCVQVRGTFWQRTEASGDCSKSM